MNGLFIGRTSCYNHTLFSAFNKRNVTLDAYNLTRAEERKKEETKKFHRRRKNFKNKTGDWVDKIGSKAAFEWELEEKQSNKSRLCVIMKWWLTIVSKRQNKTRKYLRSAGTFKLFDTHRQNPTSTALNWMELIIDVAAMSTKNAARILHWFSACKRDRLVCHSFWVRVS